MQRSSQDEQRRNAEKEKVGEACNSSLHLFYFSPFQPCWSSRFAGHGRCVIQYAAPMQSSTEKLEQGEPLSTAKLLEYLPWLKEIPAPQLKWADGAAVLRRFKRGEVVCEEGAFGSTAFYVISGSVDVFIANQIAHVKTRRGFGGLVARMKSFLVSDREEHRDENTKTFIP